MTEPVKKKRGRKPKPKVENEVPKVKKKRGRKKKCDIDALNKITGYSNVGESIDMVDNKINFSECDNNLDENCLLYTSPSPRDEKVSRMPSSA